ncbi:hypothetical protein GGF46_001245 [Coemansia sp. RSA 552]|nr:hypothetical protein GGF46_001245 [Coemansia sp. RSA 552]
MSSGRFPLLDREEERNAEVTWEDQKQINEFSRLNARLETLEEEYRNQKEEMEYLDDLSMEVELMDEDEKVPYRIGDAFVLVSLEAAQERVEKSKDKIDQHVADLDKQIAGTQDQMEVLKKSLYAKFGQAINLERN